MLSEDKEDEYACIVGGLATLDLLLAEQLGEATDTIGSLLYMSGWRTI